MITYGTYRLTSDEAYNLTLIALQHGCRSIDTAQLYNNETDVGKAIHDSNIDRDTIFLTTKIHPKLLSLDTYEDIVLNSLNKLNTHIDLLLLHAYHSDEDWHKLEQVYAKYRDKIKYIGVSNYNMINMTKLLSTCKYTPYANQIEYSPFNKRDELVYFCLQNQIKVYAYNIFFRGHKIMNEIDLSDKHSTIIKWILSKQIQPIFGTVRSDHLISNLTKSNTKLNEESHMYLENINKKMIMYPKHN